MGGLKNLFFNSRSVTHSNGIKAEKSNHTSDISFKKIYNVYKLIYKLFLYSILGFFANILARFLKID